MIIMKIMTGSVPWDSTAVLIYDMQKEHLSYVQCFKYNLGWWVGNH